MHPLRRNSQRVLRDLRPMRRGGVHIFEKKVRAFARDVPVVKPLIPDLKEQLRLDGSTFRDITPKLALVVSDKEIMDNIMSSRPQNVAEEYMRQIAARKVA